MTFSAKTSLEPKRDLGENMGPTGQESAMQGPWCLFIYLYTYVGQAAGNFGAVQVLMQLLVEHCLSFCKWARNY